MNARLNAVYKRKTLNNQKNIQFGNFTIDVQLRSLAYKNEHIPLTKKEYQLLLYFVLNKDRVLSKSSIAEHIWGDHFEESDNFDAVYIHLNNLRKKLSKYSGTDPISTVYGIGYKFVNA